MNNSNKKKIYKIIIDKGDELKNKLPYHTSHPEGRNSYAHVFQQIKLKFGVSYKNISDENLVKLKNFIDEIS